ncbi:MAG: hypothetical protein Q9190_001477 [Brigantiaea leucoxantha]
MYALWFRKPLDIREPTVISTKGFEETLALMLMCSPGFGWKPFGNFVRPKEFYRAWSNGPLNSWPVDLASEAAFLVFDRHTAQQQLSAIDVSNSPTQNFVQNNNTADSSDSGHYGTCSSTSPPSSRSLSTEDLGRHLPNTLSGSNNNTSVSSHLPKHNNEQADEPLYSQDSPPLLPCGSNVETSSGILVSPPLDVKVIQTISTGQFTKNGIGPSALATGRTRRQPNSNNNTSQLFQNFRPKGRWMIPVQVEPDLLAKLPFPTLRTTSAHYYHQLDVGLSRRDLRRWELAGAALHKELSSQSSNSGISSSLPYLPVERLGFDEPYLEIRQDNIGWRVVYAEMGDLAQYTVSHWYMPNFPPVVQAFLASLHDKNSKHELKSVFFVLLLLGVLYGGVHLFIWNGVFPTQAEHVLWNISAVTLLAVPVLIVLLTAVWLGVQKVKGLFRKDNNKKDGPDGNTDKRSKLVFAVQIVLCPVWYLFMMSFCMMALLYCFGRVFIVVESFASLRHVPKGVYEDVRWVQWIPHL